MRCIFCLQEQESSEEHVFPQSIGGSLVTDRVCRVCNSFLGAAVDAPLCDHVFIVMRRWQLRLSGNSGLVPDALKRWFGDGKLVENPEQRIQMSADPITGAPILRTLYSAIEVPQPDGSLLKRIAIDAEGARPKIKTIIQRERKRAGHPPLTDEELNRAADEILVNGPMTVERPQVNVQIGIDLAAFKRGLFKIAYELAFIWLGESYLDDPVGSTLRDVILGRIEAETAGLRGTIEFGSDIDPVLLWADDNDSHVAYSLTSGNSIAVVVKIFDIFSGVIVVSDRASDYAAGTFDPKAIRFLRIDPVIGTRRESSLLDEIGRITRHRMQQSQ